MKRRGFTLIELLAVIALIGILIATIVPPMVGNTQKMKKDLSQAQKTLIYGAAETYIKDHKNDFPTELGKKYCLTLQELVDDGLLQDELIDALDDKKVDLSMTVSVTVETKSTYNFDFNSVTKVCQK